MQDCSLGQSKSLSVPFAGITRAHMNTYKAFIRYVWTEQLGDHLGTLDTKDFR